MSSAAFSVPRELFDVEHRFLDLDGARLHYVDEGRGETLLLLHGNPSWCFVCRKIVAGLRDAYRCVAPDYPGYLREPSVIAPGQLIRASGFRWLAPAGS